MRVTKILFAKVNWLVDKAYGYIGERINMKE